METQVLADLQSGARGEFGVGTVVTYTCGKDFELRGESTRTCLESGQWNRPEPRCGEQHLIYHSTT